MTITQSDHKIAQLKKLYNEGKLIPFIGAGLSYPFNIPTWEGIIKKLLCLVPDKYQPSIEFDLDMHDYWSAVDNIKKYTNFSEFEIQEKVKDIIENMVKTEVPYEDHNYSDLGEMKFNTFLTTNYDDLLYQYLQGEKYHPIDLSIATVKSTELHNTERKKRIWHLHGSLSNTGSIVLSREGYEQVYSQEKYRNLFSTLLGNNTFLFLGFSFEDQYIKQLIKDYKSHFNNTHYIILTNPSPDRVLELKEECGLEVIPINVKDSTRVKEIRKLLQGLEAKGGTDFFFNTPTVVKQTKQLPLINNLPFKRNINFIGREVELKKIRDYFIEPDIGHKSFIVSGLGGMGKTQIAVEYSYRNIDNYRVVWWIHAENQNSILADIESLLIELKIPIKDEKNDSIVLKQLKRWMEQNNNWLLVFDNANSEEEIDNYLPNLFNGHVLITSRDSNWPGYNYPLTIDKLNREHSMDFLIRKTKVSSNECVHLDELANILNDIPLALDQAGAYIQQTGLTIKEYQDRFIKHRSILTSKGIPLDYEYTIATTWEISLNKVGSLLPVAINFINFCAFFSADNIPKKLFYNCLDSSSNKISFYIKDEFILDEILSLLKRYSIIEINGKRITMHRLVQGVIQDGLSKEEKRVTAEVCWDVISYNLSLYPDYEQLDSDLLNNSLTLVDNFESDLNFIPVILETLNIVGHHQYKKGAVREAHTIFERALKIGLGIYDGEDNRLVKEYISYAQVLSEIGKYNLSHDYLSKALECKDLNTGLKAQINCMLCTNLVALGSLDAANYYLTETLQLLESSNDLEDLKGINILDVVNNIAKQFKLNGDYKSAEKYYYQIIDFCRFAEHHVPQAKTTIASVYSSLCLMYIDLEETEKAIGYSQQAIAINEMFYPNKEHPDLARDYNNLGLAYLYSHKYDLAKKYFKRAYRIYKNIYENEINVDLVSVTNNLGMVSEAQKDLEVAKGYYETALGYLEMFNNPLHPAKAQCLFNLGAILSASGQVDKAIEMLKEVLKIDKYLYDEEHLEVAKDLGKMGELLILQGSIDEALSCLNESINIFEKKIGVNNIFASNALFNASLCNLNMRNIKVANKQFEEAISIRVNIIGLEDHVIQEYILAYELLLKKLGIDQEKFLNRLSNRFKKVY
ncbi:hypothetical protein BBR47_35820 [Brevibacillus brevis NBRC 100599]|uniref:Tetratricopeptide repeat protein n=1 Tax=Brevibacillus brevis (strain 47 / JCM 6285 / NBRC 100599) TaxID=358681 RepID=C0ZFK0_BREBN|nr:FxSxx-COOH system tetratricopeptide repeat protein [Brevibacillus brevis]BAH44559.1 hypothetical protein BBR47_35820 [Brevibacillus brevis NBRC 100599]